VAITVLYLTALVLYTLAAIGAVWLVVDSLRTRRNRRLIDRIIAERPALKPWL